MASFNEIYALAINAVPAPAALSFPVPSMRSSRLYDLFFIYSVDTAANIIEHPMSCLAVFIDESRVVNLGDIFGFETMPFSENSGYQIEGFLDKLLEARRLYEHAREETRVGLRGDMTRRYTELVKTASQPCLLPYYEAMGMDFEH